MEEERRARAERAAQDEQIIQKEKQQALKAILVKQKFDNELLKDQ
jgi:hypothetical protein